MKYIKEFEGAVETPDFLRSLLVNSLHKIIDKSSLIIFFHNKNDQYKPEYVETVDIRQERSHNIVFQINMNYLKDNKLKLDPVKHKQKIKVQLISYDIVKGTALEIEKELVLLLKDFIIDIFTKHSFFSKKSNDWYGHQDINDFFINTVEIDSIMKELNNDFEYYKTMKKYNL